MSEHEQRLGRSWDANAGAWARAVGEGRIASRRAGTDAAVLETATRLAGPPGARVLDVGCGEGWLARALAARGFAVTGIDGSAGLIERAVAAGGDVAYQLLGYDEIAARPERLAPPWALIVCNFALLAEHIEPLLGALGGALAPDGRLLIQTVHPYLSHQPLPYADGWREETFEALGGDFAEPMPWFFRTLASWSDVLAGAGLLIERLDEPRHSETGDPLSLLLTCVNRPG